MQKRFGMVEGKRRGNYKAINTEQKNEAGARAGQSRQNKKLKLGHGGQITGQPGQRNKNEAAARGGKATNSFKAVEAQLAADPPKTGGISFDVQIDCF